MQKTNSNHKQKPHVILVAHPLQGHLIPSMQLAIKLASKGLSLTFINAENIHHNITLSNPTTVKNGHDIFAEALNLSGLDIDYMTVSDGLPLEFDRSLNHDQWIGAILHCFRAHVEVAVAKIVRSQPYTCCLIADSYSIWGTPEQVKVGSTDKKKLVVVGVTISVIIVLVFLLGAWFLKRKRKYRKAFEVPSLAEKTDEIELVESLKFDLTTIQKATKNFSTDRKLGEGGFGEVYKGVLENGEYVAIKRLSSNSKQGINEFKNEVVLVAKLQHRNLVKLLGFCLSGKEKILVYEFLPNLSLDHYLSDPTRRASLNWRTRFYIIRGIARGLLYLHEDSRLKIVHRDLKPSNILLDEAMNPKIADFGMAKLFGVDQTHDNTDRIVGTFGYMAPEYIIAGRFSTKSDVYGFGIIVLELLSGLKNKWLLQHQNEEESLVYQAWTLWNEGNPLKLADPTFGNDFPVEEMTNYIHIGLLCVQDYPTKRPSMALIVAFLNGESLSLPSPHPPCFLDGANYKIGVGSLSLSTSGYGVMNDDITELYPR